jgi:chromate reductase
LIAVEDASTPSTQVLAICGSLRKRSFNRAMLNAASAIAPDGMVIEIFDTLATIPLFDEDLEEATGGGTDSVRLLRERVARADGILIATPEYNQSMPGVLKNAIDWLSRPAPDEVLSGKPVAVMGATSGPWGTRLSQAMLRQVLYATGSAVLPKPSLFVRESSRVIDEAGRLTDSRTLDQLRSLMESFQRWIALINGSLV